ncbi:MAG: hypothetical protein AAF739_02380 [Pseudomonadota bacterium]
MHLRRDGAAVVLADVGADDALALGQAGSVASVSVGIDDQRSARSEFPATGSSFAVMDVIDNCSNAEF